MILVELPWPSPLLSPNSRVHWSQRARATKKARADARVATYAALGPERGPYAEYGGPIAVRMAFRPPDMRRRDLDGMLSRCKSALDGIADALGVDDSRFTLQIERGPVHMGGRVMVTITEAAT